MARKSRESLRAVSRPLRLVALLLAASGTAYAQSGTPPPAQESSAPPSVAGTSDLVIEPQRGQTQQQEWSDRYACYDWARSQSGFDPSRESGGVPAGEVASRREQYRRAMAACLEGRGYRVREAAPAAPSPEAAPPPESAPAPHPQLRYVPHEASSDIEARTEPVREFKYHPLAVQLEGGYSVAVQNAHARLDNGWNAGLGFTWQPIAALPLAFRVDGSYSRFGENDRSLALESQATGLNIGWGREEVYGGDVDAQISLRMGPSVREYFFGGVGWYRQRIEFDQVTWEPGLRCLFWCVPGYVPVSTLAERSTSGWLDSWNAGMGFEFALTDPASFFIEARYLRLSPVSSRTAFVPIRFGLRF